MRVYISRARSTRARRRILTVFLHFNIVAITLPRQIIRISLNSIPNLIFTVASPEILKLASSLRYMDTANTQL